MVSRSFWTVPRRARQRSDRAAALATAMATLPPHPAGSLLHFRRELCADDVFSASGKRALILSHELTMTGAPIVLDKCRAGAAQHGL